MAASSGGCGERTVTELLDMRVAATPEAVAYRHESGEGQWSATSWREFGTRVGTLRSGLAAAGMRRGDRLAIIAPVSLEWELLHQAALSMGVVVVGLDAHDLPERIAVMAELAGVTAFAVRDRKVLGGIGAERLRDVRFVLALDSTMDDADALLVNVERRLSWSELERSADGAMPPPPRPAADDTATIIFTSGTTGSPKGIAYSHGQVCLAIVAICEVFDFVGSDSRLLCWLPLSNLLQRVVNLAAMRRGASTHLLGDPRRVMSVVSDVAPDIFIGVPRFYEKLYEGIRHNIAAQPAWRRALMGLAWEAGRRASRCRREQRRLPLGLTLAHRLLDAAVLSRVRGVMGHRLRCMVTGSAPMPVHLLEEFHALGWLVLEAYGLSENVVPMAINHIDDFSFGSVGRPVAGQQIVLGDDGGIRVRGAGVFAGYVGDTQRPPTDAQGFYLTGDIGAFDAQGHLRLIGRTNELIKTSTGRRVAPAAAESQLRSVEGIDQAVLIGNGRKCLVALCTCAGGSTDGASRRRLVAALRSQALRMNEHERPVGIVLLERPFSIERDELTPNLKLKRTVIEARHAAVILRLYATIDQRADVANTELVIV